ncbi:putative DNA mismatch repair protein Mlh1 C-terminus [Lyophyllum shimeji]|uniref:DNA mismatch repair protein Mlh1 C-terminus n=1 Tax=Lyophyllum shimeji TaxID=47721 RepID=A0A9P3UMY5_LYOSH|nr:putative DNA mismatch repair protein Mlh1 C-terminus [Lyophyllum shimeji]
MDNEGSPSAQPTTEPLPIRRLEESLINRIAAGEIIHRPASALKELVENSLDAGATSIRVTVKDGGMKLLQIQDNGCGIRKADLRILAERFTTSKLSTFSDLSHIRTYGFRGEALASISHVAHLSVMTKTRSDSCAWKASYTDGALAPTKPGQSVDPKPCAGNDGTTITIEDLFYNTPTRLSALRSSSEEYSRILDVLTKYAIHNPKVAFVCKKAGSPSPDLTTPSASETPNTIRLLYGHSIAKDLVTVAVSSQDPAEDEASMDMDEPEDDPEAWRAEAHITNANYQGKKMIFLLFINHRLVESSRMKRAFEAVYNGILPKGAFPFVYLSLEIDPRSVDVNVHPTKREVHFLDEEVIIEKISDAFTNALTLQNHSRTFEYQTLLTGGVASAEPELSKERKGKEREVEDDEEREPSSTLSSGGLKKKVLSQHKVRTSLKDRTLDSMFPVANPAQLSKSSSQGNKDDIPVGTLRSRDVKESECFLTSVLTLRQLLVKGKHRHLTEILEKHTFVGIVDLPRSLSLIQHSTNLYLVNHGSLAEEMFYQLGLRQFGDFSRLKLEPSPPLRTLVEIAVDAEDSTKNSNLSRPQIVDRIVNILMTRREMLAEYFSLRISDAGLVESLPLLLRDYTPDLNNLPSFLMRLGPQVDWTSETECFDTFFRELAYFYRPGATVVPYSSSVLDDEKAQEKAERWQIQHVLFPAMRRYLSAPKSLLDRDVVQVASLPDLYKVFERC